MKQHKQIARWHFVSVKPYEHRSEVKKPPRKSGSVNSYLIFRTGGFIA